MPQGIETSFCSREGDPADGDLLPDDKCGGENQDSIVLAGQHSVYRSVEVLEIAHAAGPDATEAVPGQTRERRCWAPAGVVRGAPAQTSRECRKGIPTRCENLIDRNVATSIFYSTLSDKKDDNLTCR